MRVCVCVCVYVYVYVYVRYSRSAPRVWREQLVDELLGCGRDVTPPLFMEVDVSLQRLLPHLRLCLAVERLVAPEQHEDDTWSTNSGRTVLH